LSSFGRVFDSATSSFTDFTGSDGCTDSMLGDAASSVTGFKSLRASKGNFGYIAAFTLYESPDMRSIV
jgi:hypothetical protein